MQQAEAAAEENGECSIFAWFCEVCEKRYLEAVHGLVEAAEVAVVLGRLHVVLAERLLREAERRNVQVLRLVQQPVLDRLVVAVDRDLF